MSLYQNRMVDSFDGTTIAYQVVSENGPRMVLSNGLGGNIVTWKHLIDHFRDRYAILSWDYRGLYSSGVPNDPHALSVSDQSRDLYEVMKKENIDQAILVGWSMGVQVNFEFYRRYPEKVSAIIIINGTYGRPFDTAFSKGFMKYVLPLTAKVMQRFTNYILPLAPLVVRFRQLPRVIKMTGLVAESLDENVFNDLAQDYIHMDFWYYWETFRQIGDHDAGDLLGKIRVPVLIIAGSRDPFTPEAVSQHMVRVIPRAEILVIEGGSHYTPIEFPELINHRIGTFLDKLSK